MGSLPSGISGSRAAAVLGLSQWSTPVEIWIRIMEERSPGFCEAHGYEPPGEIDNAPIRWGLAFEDAVIELEWQANDEIGDQEKVFAHPDHEFLTCHVDGVYSESGALHEGKTTNAITFGQKFGEPGSDRIPREYQIQVQHQMLCSGADRAILSVLVFPRRVDEFEEMGWKIIDPDPMTGHNIERISEDENEQEFSFAMNWAGMLESFGYFHQYHVEANPELQALMLSKYVEWWDRYVLGETAPPVEAYDDIKKLIPEPRGTVIADEETIRLSAEYKQIGEEARSIMKRKDDLKAAILARLVDGAEHPIDDDSVEAIVLRDGEGRKLHSYSKGKRGLIFR